MSKHVAIVANGDMKDYDRFKDVLSKVDLIIGVDGGLKHLEKMAIQPTIMMGDFDSIESLEFYKKIFPKAEIQTFEIRKDYTDSELAVRKLIEMKAEQAVLLGVTGNRLDHTLANISLLKVLYDSGVQGSIVNEDNVIHYTEDKLELEAEIGTNMSILPMSDKVTGIYLDGFEYPLENATLVYGSTTGISNVFAKEEASIRIESGRIVVMQSRD